MEAHPLPIWSSWRFDEIASSEPERARKLASAGSPERLLAALVETLNQAQYDVNLRFGREPAEKISDEYRVVIQFAVGTDVFDWFFNARSGYRAHFRAHYSVGIEFNMRFINIVRDRLMRLPDAVPGRQLNSMFQDCGKTMIEKSFVLASLVPDLSKVWFCTKLIQARGGVQLLPTGLTGPKLLLEGGIRWAAPYREEESAWLDVKGAFLGKGAAYQPKDPVQRAKRLHASGEA